MKKIFAVLLALTILLTALQLSGCRDEIGDPEGTSELGEGTTLESTTEDTTEDTTAESETEESLYIPESDTWDGSVAMSFAKGNGTEGDPYLITSAEQLAFLAKEINSGKNYTGKNFSLMCDIDLANRSWTPIGNGIHSFMGNFDGNGHTIGNLKISQSIHYTYEYPTGKNAPYCDSGLFATVQDASIQNMIIDGATIEIVDTKNGDDHRVGVLCGAVRTYQSASVISNIDIKNATITADFLTNQSPRYLSIGGAIGHIYAYNNTTTTISLIETDCAVSFIDGYSSNNYIGTILGSSNVLESTFNMENCAAYQTLSVSIEQYYYTDAKSFCGAIGKAQASVKPFAVKNIFSKCTINKPVLDSAMIPQSVIFSRAIIGESYYFALKDDPNAVGYRFENVFGCVEHIDTAGEKQILTDLYALPLGPDFAQINCQGCEVLPENHGFDSTIWDLSDLTKPKLKEQ